jgi:hypothetical protein
MCNSFPLLQGGNVRQDKGGRMFSSPTDLLDYVQLDSSLRPKGLRWNDVYADKVEMGTSLTCHSRLRSGISNKLQLFLNKSTVVSLLLFPLFQ